MKARVVLLLKLVVLVIVPLAAMAQTLTSTFQFTGSGLIGTPATASTPFQGRTFTNVAITISAIGNTGNRASCCSSGYYIPNNSASISIAGIGTFQFTSQTFLLTNPRIDPIKGVTGVEYGFYTAIGNNPWWGVEDLIYSQSSSWNMEQSFGPITTTISTSGWNLSGGLTTNGGTVQLSDGSSSGMFQVILTGTPPPPSVTRTGVLSHIAAGGGWTTLITLVNNSSTALPVTVALHDENGGALSLPVTTTLQGVSQKITTSSINATINPKATLLISAGDGIASTAVGWADVLSSGTLGGFAIFRQTPQNGSPSEGTVPLQSQYPTTITLPYDDSASFVMGVALANLSTTTANITATIWDDSGNQIGIQNVTIAGDGHTSFVLPTQIPVTAGKRGIVQFQSPGGLAGLGLRFSPFGTFTSVPTM